MIHLASISAVPGPLVPALVATGLGLILWLAGNRTLRPMLALAGGLLGAGIGWTVVRMLAGEAAAPAAVPPWLGATLAGLVLACLAALLQRLAVAVALAGVLAVGAPLVALTVHDLDPRALPDDAPVAMPEPVTRPVEPVVDDANDWLFPPEASDAETEGTVEWATRVLGERAGVPDAVTGSIGTAAETANQAAEDARGWWDGVPAAIQPLVAGCAVCGLLAGLLLGSIFPRTSAAVVTGFGGALLWMAGVATLADGAGFGARTWLLDTPAYALVLWLVISLVGTAIQWTARPKSADSAA